MRSNSYLAPGTRVRLNTDEVGVVVHCWHDSEINAFDCYVAFFGTDFPRSKPTEKPYILRYAATSLTVLADAPQ